MDDADHIEIAGQIRAFGENLRRARRRAGLTQVQLSAAAPLDRAAISRLECGERAPDLSTLLRLSAALDTRPTDLLRGIGPKTPARRTRRHEEATADDGPAALFGANLRWARGRAGVSQERLALDAKVDRAAVSVYENGGREPNLRTVLKLALKLEIRPSMLLAGIALGTGMPAAHLQ
jgi:transcriptional regulator with XRE-family HTH domain